MPPESSRPNPKRVAAGRLNRAKRGPLTDRGRERLRQSALVNRPWRFSTGPRTDAGKDQARTNGRKRQKGEQSVRELQCEVAEINGLIQRIKQLF